MKINLGCGSDIKRGFINVDMVKAPGVDIVCDLNKYHYPFESNSADMILMQHSLEHLFEPYKAIVECHRILKPNGILEIEVPYGFNYSLYHYHFFNEESLVTIYTKKSDPYKLIR